MAYKLILNRVLAKVEVLESNSNNNNLSSTTSNYHIDSSFLLLFPIKNKEEFLSIENKIVNEIDFVSMLVNYF